MAHCLVCGNELKVGGRFCTFCGNGVLPEAPAVTLPSSAPVAVAVSCGVCQAGNPPGQKFCTRCGAALAAPASASGGFTPAKRTPVPLLVTLFAIPIAGAAGWFAFQHWQADRSAEAPIVTTAHPAPSPLPVAVAEPAPSPGTQAPSSRPISPPIAHGSEPVPVAESAAPVRMPVQRPKPPAQTSAPAPAPVQGAVDETPEPTPAPETSREPVSAAVPAPPAEPVPSRTPVFQPERTYRPEPETPSEPRYSGPATGVLVWSGRLERGAAVTIEGDRPDTGTLNGALPGVPVMVEITPSDVAVAEPPGPGNGWKRISVRSRKNRHTVVTIRWRVL